MGISRLRRMISPSADGTGLGHEDAGGVGIPFPGRESGTLKARRYEEVRHPISAAERDRFVDIRERRRDFRLKFLDEKPDDFVSDLKPPSDRAIGFSEKQSERTAKTKVRKSLAAAVTDLSDLCCERPLTSIRALQLDRERTEKQVATVRRKRGDKSKARNMERHLEMLDSIRREAQLDSTINERIRVDSGTEMLGQKRSLFAGYFHPKGLGPFSPDDLAQIISASELESIVYASVALMGDDYSRAVGRGLSRALLYRAERGEGLLSPRLSLVSDFREAIAESGPRRAPPSLI